MAEKLLQLLELMMARLAQSFVVPSRDKIFSISWYGFVAVVTCRCCWLSCD